MLSRYYKDKADKVYRATRERAGLDWRLREIHPVFSGTTFYVDDVGVRAYERVKSRSLTASMLRRSALTA